MLTVEELANEIALHIHDTNNAEFTPAHLLTFINSAARDFRNGGWYLPADMDDTIVVTANTQEYAIPLPFANLKDVLQSETVNGTTQYYPTLPRGHWKPIKNGVTPKLYFHTQTSLIVGRTLRLVGQKRPTIYGSMQEEVDDDLESDLRERAISYALMAVGHGGSELAQTRKQMGLLRRQLQRPYPPADMREWNDAKRIPGR